MSRRRPLRHLLSVHVLLVAAMPLISAGPAGADAPASPGLRMFAASSHVTVTRYGGKRIYLQAGIYVEAAGSPLQLEAAKAAYGSPIRVSQDITSGGISTSRPLPAWVATSWRGLHAFEKVTVTDSSGQVVMKDTPAFCPDAWGAQRVDPSSPQRSQYPTFCSQNPFTKGVVWGIERGWAVDALGQGARSFKGPDGTYDVHVQITRRYQKLFDIPAADSSATVAMTVTTDTGGCPPICEGPAAVQSDAPLANVATTNDPSPRTEPDLVALPAWGISTDSYSAPGSDYLDFGATVWDAGPAPMVVEGFRPQGKATMRAWQYFYRNGHPMGRTRAGTLKYDARPGHEHWHFTQFATYRLLDASKGKIVRSQKEAFCLAPTDAINLTAPGAVWNPDPIGLSTACGDATSIWTRETLPAGWGDTYFQGLPGQSFDITNLPNGTYYIQVQANPGGIIHERIRSNDTRLRKIILGGTPGNRTVTVPPWHGINSEGRGYSSPFADGLSK